MKTVNIGVIGCGSIARNRHIPEYEANEHTNIRAVCDLVKERAEETASRLGASAYTDYHELLKDESIEAVSVCTSNHMHARISIDALAAGKHVLCEKPMATSAQEAEEMIEAEKRSGKKLMIAHNQRFVPSHVKARELIANGELGKIFSFRTTFGHGGPEGWSIDGKDSWFFKKEEAFIGAMGDLGVHKSDLIQFLLDEPVTQVAAFVENNAKENITVDDNAVCLLRTAGGLIGTLTASWAYVPEEDNSTIIYGEKGTLRLEDDPVHSLTAHYTNGHTVRYELGGIQTNDAGGQEGSGVIDAFTESIVSNTEVPVSGADGKQALAVILAALASSERGQFVTIGKEGVQ